MSASVLRRKDDMNKLKELQEKNLKIRNEISNIQDEREKELLPKYRKQFVGKCFKYRNSYGGDRPKWWLYIKILDVNSVNFCNNEEPVFDTLRVEKCSDGGIHIKKSEYDYVRSDDHIAISAKEFNKAMAGIIKSVHEYLTEV